MSDDERPLNSMKKRRHKCPPLPPLGADGKPAHIMMARAHRTVPPAALIRP